MALSQDGRVQLKIYDAHGALLIARPFESEKAARLWYAQWKQRSPNPGRQSNPTTFQIVAMVPTI